MRQTGEILLPLPIEEAFSLLTQPDQLAAMYPDLISTEYRQRTDHGVGTQTANLYHRGTHKVEIIGTVVDFAPPFRIASHMLITRHLPLEPHELVPGVEPLDGSDLDTAVFLTYGKLPVEGLELIELAESNEGTSVTMVLDIKLRNLAMLEGIFQRLIGQSPIQKLLDGIATYVDGPEYRRHHVQFGAAPPGKT